MEEANHLENNSHSKIDEVYQEILSSEEYIPERWLLVQTLYTASARRGIFSFLPIVDGAQILDIGTGFGALTFDLASFKDVEIHGVDVSVETLHVANEIHKKLVEQNAFKSNSKISFSEDNVYQLSFDDSTFDFVIARYVFQHLDKPQIAMHEIKRVLKPGGFVCLVDIDDQLLISYPEDTGLSKLSKALRLLQEHRGGDRYVGRKLSSYMEQAGLAVLGNIIQPEAQFSSVPADDRGLQLTIARFTEAKQDIVCLGIMSEEQFDKCLESYIKGMQEIRYQTTGNFITVGRRL